MSNKRKARKRAKQIKKERNEHQHSKRYAIPEELWEQRKPVP